MALGVLMLLVSVAVAYALPVMTAKCWISIRVERQLIFVSYGAVLYGAILLFYYLKKRTPSKATLAAVAGLVGGGVALGLVLLALTCSNDIFFKVATQHVPTDAWPRLKSGLDGLTKSTKKPEGADAAEIPSGTLPSEFDSTLGKRDSYNWGSVSGSKKKATVVTYGDEARVWGLYTGGSPTNRWPDAKVMEVGENTWYFVSNH